MDNHFGQFFQRLLQLFYCTLEYGPAFKIFAWQIVMLLLRIVKFSPKRLDFRSVGEEPRLT
jgi:hypothetical protein